MCTIPQTLSCGGGGGGGGGGYRGGSGYETNKSIVVQKGSRTRVVWKITDKLHPRVYNEEKRVFSTLYAVYNMCAESNVTSNLMHVTMQNKNANFHSNLQSLKVEAFFMLFPTDSTHILVFIALC